MKATMMKISARMNGKDTFQLIPTTRECPFQEAVFNLETKMLTIVHPHSYESFQFLTRVNDDGNFQRSKTHQSGYKQERIRLTKNFDYNIYVKEEIQKFVDIVTGESNDLSEYFKVEEKKEEPKVKTVETSPTNEQ